MKSIFDYETVILASQSPRRLEILRAHGIDPVVRPTDADETLPDGIGMEDAVRYLSSVKAEACLRDLASLGPEAMPPDALLVAADTVVYTDRLGIMGKPADQKEAFLMLSTIRGTFHFVATGVTLIDTGTAERLTFADVTEVWCKEYSDADIMNYIEQEKPYDKAGAYAIQGPFGSHIDHITGDYENVVGLPFDRIEAELAKDCH